MQVKRYEVANVQEALGRIKSDLGPDAIILSTKTIANSQPRLIEVIAAADRDEGGKKPERTAAPERRPDPQREGAAAGGVDFGRQMQEIKEMLAAMNQTRKIHEELAELKEGMNTLFHVLGLGGKYRENDVVSKFYRRLLGNGVGKTKAAKIIGMIQKDPRFFKVRNYEELVVVAEQCLADSLFPPRPDRGGKRLKVLVGPTGVGKTTTLAKLAARYKIDEKKKTGLITTDTYRIAAVEQLKIYAKILGVPLYVAGDNEGFRKSLRALADHDVILVDTPGKSPGDTEYLQRLQEMFSPREALDIHLLLSSTASRETLLAAAERYRVLKYDRIALTKIDECISFGNLYDVLDQTGTAVSYVTNGQNVPQDIEEVSPREMAKLIISNTLH
ncbi:MAG TPA: flagellar biosynthesis protein FlhF [Syntrophales bacterium]|jgi:flagellar biosynthesis protein FlhF|nr:flagellar biosynthesis protein FlhF [Syntrophales bacterium]HOU78414.1 flagellar biosynthesis protein FlhF [Syntrophales bacterium]HPC33114.1 flagellar biosynthesis protein FlhF [Syntrophales bacterium]HQG35231.1 flagellar biosynthesis protein FlhF [Syntrophales bacterium]HQI35574.1 flagellar biosynthesis protein FlhF [Syntrophales bacterium]